MCDHSVFLHQAVDKRLRSLHFKYKLLIPAADLDETRKQFMEKQILISVLGCQNIGKSTLLNSLLRARLACNYIHIAWLQGENGCPTSVHNIGSRIWGGMDIGYKIF